MKWPFGSKPAQAAKNQPAVYPTYEVLTSFLDYPDSNPPSIDPAEIAPWTVSLMRIRLGNATDSDLALAMRSAWDGLYRYGRERKIKSYREAQASPLCTPASVAPLLVSTFSYAQSGANSSPANFLNDDVVIIWPQLASDPVGEPVLCLNAAAVGARGPFELTAEYVAEGLTGGQMQGVWNEVSNNLRQYAKCVAISVGFFPDAFSFAERSVQIPSEGEPLEVFAWLLSKHATSTHEDTVMTYKVSGNAASRFVLESVGNLRSGGGRQYHSGSILIDLDNVAHCAAVRWTNDFGLQITFKRPVQFSATNFIPPSWKEEQVKLMLYDKVITCDTFEDAAALQAGFARLLEGRNSNIGNASVPKPTNEHDSKSDVPNPPTGDFRVVEEAD